MTIDTCKRLAEHCRKMGDEAGAKIYEERIVLRGGSVEEPKKKGK